MKGRDVSDMQSDNRTMLPLISTHNYFGFEDVARGMTILQASIACGIVT